MTVTSSAAFNVYASGNSFEVRWILAAAMRAVIVFPARFVFVVAGVVNRKRAGNVSLRKAIANPVGVFSAPLGYKAAISGVVNAAFPWPAFARPLLVHEAPVALFLGALAPLWQQVNRGIPVSQRPHVVGVAPRFLPSCGLSTPIDYAGSTRTLSWEQIGRAAPRPSVVVQKAPTARVSAAFAAVNDAFTLGHEKVSFAPVYHKE